MSRPSGPFKNEDILSPEFLPDILPHRESQIMQIAKNMEHVTSGGRAQDTFVYGPPGIGKTATIKFIFRQMEEENPNSKSIYINCWDCNTSVAVMSAITISLGIAVPRRGLGKDEILQKFSEALSKTKKSLVICLDEVDQLVSKDQSALYDLFRSGHGKKMGLIFISNNEHVFSSLEPRIRSSMNVEEIGFRPYSISEMKDILEERASLAFESIESGSVILAANHAVKKGGDVRVGLQVLQRAGREAAKESARKLSVGYVKSILSNVGKAKTEILKSKVGEAEKKIVSIVTDGGRMSFGEIYKKYSSSGGDVSERTFQKYMNHLTEVGLIRKLKNKIEGKRLFEKA